MTVIKWNWLATWCSWFDLWLMTCGLIFHSSFQLFLIFLCPHVFNFDIYYLSRKVCFDWHGTVVVWYQEHLFFHLAFISLTIRYLRVSPSYIVYFFGFTYAVGDTCILSLRLFYSAFLWVVRRPWPTYICLSIWSLLSVQIQDDFRM